MNNNVNINTNFQNGDNNVHIGPEARRLNEKTEKQLKELLPLAARINVASVLGDGEAYNFAEQIKSYLQNQGYQVDGVDQVVYSNSVNGQMIEKPKDGNNTYQLIIGHNHS